MKKYGIKVPRRRDRNNFCTKSVKHRKYPNLIQDLQISYENQVWCGVLIRVSLNFMEASGYRDYY